MASGGPAFLLALPLNYLLVERAGLAVGPAYALVLVTQVTINFFVCRRFVFESGESASLAREFVEFVTGILGLRLADWLLYLWWVDWLGVYFLAAQVANVVVFALLKFRFAERVFDRARA
jgi:putative flippase GtrA